MCVERLRPLWVVWGDSISDTGGKHRNQRFWVGETIGMGLFEGATFRSFAGTKSAGLEPKRNVVETWREGDTSAERLSWSSAWMARVEGC